MIKCESPDTADAQLKQWYFWALYLRFYKSNVNRHDIDALAFRGFDGTANFLSEDSFIGVGPGQTLSWTGDQVRLQCVSDQVLVSPRCRQHLGGNLVHEQVKYPSRIGAVYAVSSMFVLTPVLSNYAVFKVLEPTCSQ